MPVVLAPSKALVICDEAPPFLQLVTSYNESEGPNFRIQSLQVAIQEFIF